MLIIVFWQYRSFTTCSHLLWVSILLVKCHTEKAYQYRNCHSKLENCSWLHLLNQLSICWHSYTINATIFTCIWHLFILLHRLMGGILWKNNLYVEFNNVFFIILVCIRYDCYWNVLLKLCKIIVNILLNKMLDNSTLTILLYISLHKFATARLNMVLLILL